jgi:hypothetical protein
MPAVAEILDPTEQAIFHIPSGQWYATADLSDEELGEIVALSTAVEDPNSELYTAALAAGYAGEEGVEAVEEASESFQAQALAEGLEEIAADPEDPDQAGAQEALEVFQAAEAGLTPEELTQLHASWDQLTNELGRSPTGAEWERMAKEMNATQSSDAVLAYTQAVGSRGKTEDGRLIPGRDKSDSAERTKLATEVADDVYAEHGESEEPESRVADDRQQDRLDKGLEVANAVFGEE